ncbi:hypothetical protein [Legionella tunisiensis]|uniref:hypothetical protein n=1 Tax=Legionella tunisiensis TaxID=1034944 RepID=UPI00031CA748|nr:hypothetical protein [Legionella tunisiensis]
MVKQRIKGSKNKNIFNTDRPTPSNLRQIGINKTKNKNKLFTLINFSLKLVKGVNSWITNIKETIRKGYLLK